MKRGKRDGVVGQGMPRVPVRGWGWPRVAEASAGLSPLHKGGVHGM